MSAAFCGIDFADAEKANGRCWLRDDGETLSDTCTAEGELRRTAVDCPFGTSRGFEALLRGEEPPKSNDGFKARVTEQVLGARIGDFRIVREWRDLPAKDRDGVQFFNRGSHIQPAVGLVIVPALLHWLMHSLGGSSPFERLTNIQKARRGEGPIVEAHPRLFLYSAMECIRARTRIRFTPAMMVAIARYKCEGATGVNGRRIACELLTAQAQSWMPPGQSRRVVVQDAAALCDDDHKFDAWLAALTAWCHHQGATWSWADAKIDRAQVDIEGHILVLATPEGSNV